MNTFCPICEQETEINKIIESDEIDIRGEIISVEKEYFHCQKCDEKFENLHPEMDYMDFAYREYRRRKAWLQPEDIKVFRDSLGLTQQQFSDILGIGVATLNRYENGSLQSEAHEQLIRFFVDDPSLILGVLNRKPNLLTKSEQEKLTDYLHQIEKGKSVLVRKTIENLANYSPDIFSGGKTFDFRKLIHVFKFFCYNSRIYKTKLNKLLFYADYLHYRDYGVSITGLRYAHAPFGPVPNNFETWLVASSKWIEEIESEEVYFDENVGETFMSDDPPDMNVFQPSEIKVLQSIKEKFLGFSCREITNYSHDEIGYKNTKDGELISYIYAQDLRV